MDGEVWAESPAPPQRKSEKGDVPGSIFHFTAWFERSMAKEKSGVESISLSGKRVLVVDDNRNSLELLKQTLESAGMIVLSLVNGEDVLPTLKNTLNGETPFDLCIMDIHLSGMSGYELAEEIRQIEMETSKHGSQTRPLPLLAISASKEGGARRSAEAGFNAFFPKPIRRDQLLEMVVRMLGESEASRGGRTKEREEGRVTQSASRDRKQLMRILLVEDNPVNQKLAKLMLTKAGYEVEVAGDGKVAVEKYTQTPDKYNLIFMDIQMPVMDGLQATMEIRKWEGLREVPGEKATGSSESELKIPIVAMTANAMEEDRKKCLEAGLDDYITKPIKKALLIETLDKWV
jgi:CheY-like chemotaxis protein